MSEGRGDHVRVPTISPRSARLRHERAQHHRGKPASWSLAPERDAIADRLSPSVVVNATFGREVLGECWQHPPGDLRQQRALCAESRKIWRSLQLVHEGTSP